MKTFKTAGFTITVTDTNVSMKNDAGVNVSLSNVVLAPGKGTAEKVAMARAAARSGVAALNALTGRNWS